jgi:hypothetical protein
MKSTEKMPKRLATVSLAIGAVLSCTACATTKAYNPPPVFNQTAHQVFDKKCNSILGELADDPELMAECREQRYVEHKEAIERENDKKHDKQIQGRDFLGDVAGSATAIVLDRLIDSIF